MDKIVGACDHFEFDEEKAVSFKKFFQLYKDQLPMLVVIIDGYYGETIYDCFDNFQVMRIACYTTQPRVVCVDSKQANPYKYQFFTIPVNYDIKYRVVKGHSNVGPSQSMSTIIQEHDLSTPVLIKLDCDPRQTIRVGNSDWHAEQFGNLLITQKYDENYFLANCVDGSELKMHTQMCQVMLSDELTVTPITGFKYQSRERFVELQKRLEKQVAEGGQEYDTAKGNKNFMQYSSQTLNLQTGKGGIPTYPPIVIDIKKVIPDKDYGPKPKLPPRRGVSEEEPTDDYEEIDPEWTLPPVLPKRTHKPATPGSQGLPPKEHLKDKTTKHARAEHDLQKEKAHKTGGGKKEKKTAKQISTHVSDKCTPDLKVPKRQPIPAKEVAALDSLGEPKLKREYQNTMIGRATVKPFVRDKGDTKPTSGPGSLIDGRPPAKSPVADPQIYSTVYEFPDGMQKRYEELSEEDIASIKTASKTSGNGSYSKLDKKAPTTPQLSPSGNDASSETEQKETFSISNLTIDDLAGALKTLKLDKYNEVFRDNDIDGEILSSLTVDDLVKELRMGKLEAVRLHTFAKSGHVPK